METNTQSVIFKLQLMCLHKEILNNKLYNPIKQYIQYDMNIFKQDQFETFQKWVDDNNIKTIDQFCDKIKFICDQWDKCYITTIRGNYNDKRRAEVRKSLIENIKSVM